MGVVPVVRLLGDRDAGAGRVEREDLACGAEAVHGRHGEAKYLVAGGETRGVGPAAGVRDGAGEVAAGLVLLLFSIAGCSTEYEREGPRVRRWGSLVKIYGLYINGVNGKGLGADLDLCWFEV